LKGFYGKSDYLDGIKTRSCGLYFDCHVDHRCCVLLATKEKEVLMSKRVPFVHLSPENQKKRALLVLEEMMDIINCANAKTSRDNTAGRLIAHAFRDVLTSLRGPDNTNYTLKSCTTAFVRGWLGVKHTSGLDVREPIFVRKDNPDRAALLAFHNDIARGLPYADAWDFKMVKTSHRIREDLPNKEKYSHALISAQAHFRVHIARALGGLKVLGLLPE